MKEGDLDHKQDETDNIQKSEDPAKDYMDKKSLCPQCHGPIGKCKCSG